MSDSNERSSSLPLSSPPDLVTGKSNTDTSRLLLQLNLDRVAAESIEGDVIIINVMTGTYYSTQGIGGWVWEQCAAGHTIPEIVSRGCATFEVSNAQFESDLLVFAETLKAEDLVSKKLVEPAAQLSQETPSPKKIPYTAPALVIYRDLKDLLALDPPMPRLSEKSKF